MDSIGGWATAIRVVDRFQGGGQKVRSDLDPSIMVQCVVGNLMLCGSATEYFSQRMPVRPPTPTIDDYLPIDILYGCYDPTSRSIQIFINRIQQDAKLFDAEPFEIQEIVRIHEHAHAVVHLGSRAHHANRDLSAFGGAERTDWPAFVSDRTTRHMNLSEEIHEFLAQAITHDVIRQLCAYRGSDRLLKVFDSLEARQPPHYRLAATVKLHEASTDWPMVLDAARGAISTLEGPGFTLRAGLEALVCDSGAQK